MSDSERRTARTSSRRRRCGGATPSSTSSAAPPAAAARRRRADPRRRRPSSTPRSLARSTRTAATQVCRCKHKTNVCIVSACLKTFQNPNLQNLLNALFAGERGDVPLSAALHTPYNSQCSSSWHSQAECHSPIFPSTSLPHRYTNKDGRRKLIIPTLVVFASELFLQTNAIAFFVSICRYPSKPPSSNGEHFTRKKPRLVHAVDNPAESSGWTNSPCAEQKVWSGQYVVPWNGNQQLGHSTGQSYETHVQGTNAGEACPTGRARNQNTRATTARGYRSHSLGRQCRMAPRQYLMQVNGVQLSPLPSPTTLVFQGHFTAFEAEAPANYMFQEDQPARSRWCEVGNVENRDFNLNEVGLKRKDEDRQVRKVRVRRAADADDEREQHRELTKLPRMASFCCRRNKISSSCANNVPDNTGRSTLSHNHISKTVLNNTQEYNPSCMFSKKRTSFARDVKTKSGSCADNSQFWKISQSMDVLGTSRSCMLQGNDLPNIGSFLEYLEQL